VLSAHTHQKPTTTPKYMQQTAKGAGCGGNHLDHATSKPQPAPHGSQDPILLVSPDATGLRWASTSGRCCNASERYPGAHTPRGEVEVVFAQCSLPGNTTSCQSVCTRYRLLQVSCCPDRPRLNPSTTPHHTTPHRRCSHGARKSLRRADTRASNIAPSAANPRARCTSTHGAQRAASPGQL
jgi:hypothetical protein